MILSDYSAKVQRELTLNNNRSTEEGEDAEPVWANVPRVCVEPPRGFSIIRTEEFLPSETWPRKLSESLGVTLVAEIDVRSPLGVAGFCELALTRHVQQAEGIAITMGLVAGHAGRSVILGRP